MAIDIHVHYVLPPTLEARILSNASRNNGAPLRNVVLA